MGLTLITPPTAALVQLSEVKTLARILDTSFDTILTDHIAMAQAMVETKMGRSLAPQTWRLTIDQFADQIRLPRGPVSSVTSVKYYDTNGIQQTIAPSLYTVDLTSDPQWIVLNQDEDWPDTLDAVNAVEITYVAGYAATDPGYKAAQQAIRALALHWYENGQIGTIPPGVVSIMFPYANHGF